MNFISLIKWKQPPRKDLIEQSTERLKDLEKQGIKLHVYWTLGRYDAVTIIEAPNENEAMKTILLWKDVIDTETMVAIPREEAIKVL